MELYTLRYLVHLETTPYTGCVGSQDPGRIQGDPIFLYNSPPPHTHYALYYALQHSPHRNTHYRPLSAALPDESQYTINYNTYCSMHNTNHYTLANTLSLAATCTTHN